MGKGTWRWVLCLIPWFDFVSDWFFSCFPSNECGGKSVQFSVLHKHQPRFKGRRSLSDYLYDILMQVSALRWARSQIANCKIQVSCGSICLAIHLHLIFRFDAICMPLVLFYTPLPITHPGVFGGLQYYEHLICVTSAKMLNLMFRVCIVVVTSILFVTRWIT